MQNQFIYLAIVLCEHCGKYLPKSPDGPQCYLSVNQISVGIAWVHGHDPRVPFPKSDLLFHLQAKSYYIVNHKFQSQMSL